MQDIAPIKLAIELGHLLKINYANKAHPINSGVIRPLRFNNKGKLITYNYDSSSERILDTKHITEILPFQPRLVGGDDPADVQDFRWLVGKQERQHFSRKLKWGPIRFQQRKISWQLLPSAAPIRPRHLVSTQQGDRNIGSK